MTLRHTTRQIIFSIVRLFFIFRSSFSYSMRSYVICYMKVMIDFSSKLSDRLSTIQFLEGFLPRDVGLTIVSYLRESTAYVVVTKLRYNNIFDINII